MKLQLNEAMNPDILSRDEKDALAKELYKVVEKYCRNWGALSVEPRVSYFEHDILEYTFRVNSTYYNRDSMVVLNHDYELPEFKAAIKSVLRAHGFKRSKFDFKTFKRQENDGYYHPTPVYTAYKELIAIYFA